MKKKIRNKKFSPFKSDCPDSNIPKRNSRTICYDLPECYDPCSNAIKYPPIQLPPLPRQQPRYPRDPCRDLFDPCHDYYDRSTIVSNLQLSPRTSTRKLICYECPEKGVSSRSPRYKTVKPALKREDTFLDDCDYKEERNRKDSDRRDRDRDRDRRYTVVNSNNQQYYSDNKNGKLNEEFDGIPKDRIYEIRKEKILIKADKSPERTQERYRSKSSEKYLDSKYDDGHGSYKVYERDDTGNNNGIRKQLQSRSVYVLKDDRESSPERQSYSDHKYSNKNSSNANQTSSVNAPAISTVGNSDIVYVPMVKEDFIKRECKKLENINTGNQKIK